MSTSPASVTTLIVEGDSASVRVQVYPATDAVDGLVWVHGGGFRSGSLDMPEADWVSRELASRGHTVVSVDYRLVTESIHFPAPSDDVLAAWRWAAAQRDFPISGDWHLGGASAGANLALGAVLRLRDDPDAAEPPRSVILAYPTLHMVQPESSEVNRIEALIPPGSVWGPRVVREMYERFIGPRFEGAPGYAIPGDIDPHGLPPTLVIASEFDGLRRSAEGYARSLSDAGVDHTFAIEPGTSHGHLNRPSEPAAKSSIARIHDWLAARR